MVLVDAQQLGKDDDGKNVVQGGAGQDQGGNPLFGPFALLHEMDHQGHHHRGGDGADNRSQHCGLEPGERQEVDRGHGDGGHLHEGREKAHEQGRTGGAV